MSNWYWEKKELRNTPSHAKNMDSNTETRYRREGVRFIFELGISLKFGHNTMATGAVYYHRFYMFHAFQDFNRYVVATCCLFLAGKAEETPKKCRDIVRAVRQLTNDRQFSFFGDDPREEIIVLERVLLQTLKFDFQVDLPYNSIFLYAKSLDCNGDQNKLNEMVQKAFTFCNDSLRTTLCLQWEPEIIAIAVMFLAIKLSKFEVKDWANRRDHHRNWWDQFVEGLDPNDLEEICHQVLDYYSHQSATATKDATVSPPPGAFQKPVQRVTPKPVKSKPSATKPPTPSVAPQLTHSKSRRHTPPPIPSAAAPPSAPPIPPPPAPNMPPQGPNHYPRPPMPQAYSTAHPMAGGPPPAGYPVGYPPRPPPRGYPPAPPPGAPAHGMPQYHPGPGYQGYPMGHQGYQQVPPNHPTHGGHPPRHGGHGYRGHGYR